MAPSTLSVHALRARRPWHEHAHPWANTPGVDPRKFAALLVDLSFTPSRHVESSRPGWEIAGRLLGDLGQLALQHAPPGPAQAQGAPPPASASVGRAEAVLLIGGAAVSCNPTTLTLTLTLQP